MTFSCVLLLALSQTGLPPELQPEPIPVPGVAPDPQPPEPPSVVTRSLLGIGGGTLAGAASLGLAVLPM